MEMARMKADKEARTGPGSMHRSGTYSPAVVRMLRDEGLLEEAPDPRYGGRTPAYRATAVGLRALAALEAAPHSACGA
jgi:alkylation response protein AidB-like acyl-CoA dehydrogenase